MVPENRTAEEALAAAAAAPLTKPLLGARAMAAADALALGVAWGRSFVRGAATPVGIAGTLWLTPLGSSREVERQNGQAGGRSARQAGGNPERPEAAAAAAQSVRARGAGGGYLAGMGPQR